MDIPTTPRFARLLGTPAAQEAQRRAQRRTGLQMAATTEQALILFDRMTELGMLDEVRRLIERAQRRADMANDLPALPGEAKAA